MATLQQILQARGIRPGAPVNPYGGKPPYLPPDQPIAPAGPPLGKFFPTFPFPPDWMSQPGRRPPWLNYITPMPRRPPADSYIPPGIMFAHPQFPGWGRSGWGGQFDNQPPIPRTDRLHYSTGDQAWDPYYTYKSVGRA